ncbi:helix-turn-helix transcriptional regulator [Thaumasiovibrio subtropicus]|uniref:helix-turn-helix transcriptional regulator n=1 Tax=Thaumasiovibrio subtropicus TaxID=1891207 RepID=UPI000B34CF21|nr:helix-turn-helix transcriptional regulator [Thaumasiovibrio subtropicus]
MKPTILIPEVALLNTLPDHHRRRFEKALSLMFTAIETGESLDWSVICEACAVSSYHFLRQFQALFSETPGQYFSRMKLQYAASLLFEQRDRSITDVALAVGFSSSQALAKALKRDLGMTAKEIRRIALAGDMQDVSAFWRKLAHPSNTPVSLEQQLALSLECQIVSHPTRRLRGRYLTGVQWDDYFYSHPKGGIGLTMLTPFSELDKPVKEAQLWVGEWCKVRQGETDVAAGDYFSCEVWVSSDGGYLAAWDSLYKQLLQQGLEVTETGFCIESLLNIDESEAAALFRFEIPVQRQEEC